MFVIYIFLTALFGFVILKFIKKSKPSFPHSYNEYTWGQILWPFDSKPFTIYRYLSPENKVSFWSIASSTIIGIITFWLGFSMQYFVYNSTTSEASKLSHYEVIDKFTPIYDEYMDSTTVSVLDSICYLFSLHSDNDSVLTECLKDYVNDSINESNLMYTAQRTIDVMQKLVPYYTNQDDKDSIYINCHLLLRGMDILNYGKSYYGPMDSLNYIKMMQTKTFSFKYAKVIGINNKTLDVIEKTYSYAKSLHDLDDDNLKKITKLSIQSQMIVAPILKIQLLLLKLTSIKETIDPFKICLFFLLLSLFLGYMLFRIILMKSLNEKSLKPNPLYSKDVLDKVIKETKGYKLDNENLLNSIERYKVQVEKLVNEEKTLRMSLDKKVTDYEMRLQELENKITSYEDLINKLTNENKLLNDKVNNTKD